MTLDQFEIVSAIVEHGGFREASKKLHKSQSSLSVAIKNLEDELGFKIFERKQKNSIITLNGKLVLEEALKALNATEKIKRIGLELGKAKPETQITIGIDIHLPSSFLKAIILESQKVSPQTTIFFKDSFTSILSNLNQSQEMDFIISSDIFYYPDYEMIPLYNDTLTPCIKKSVYDSLNGSEAKIIKHIPQVLLNFDGLHFQSHLNLDHEPPIVKGPIILVSDPSLKTKLIQEGHGWGRILCDNSTKSKNNLIELKSIPRSSCIRNVVVMKKRNRPIGVVGQSLWNYFLMNRSTSKNIQTKLFV